MTGAAIVLLAAAAAVPRPAADLSWRDGQGQTRSLRAQRGATVILQFFNPN